MISIGEAWIPPLVMAAHDFALRNLFLCLRNFSLPKVRIQLHLKRTWNGGKGLAMWLSWHGACLACTKPWIQSLAPHKRHGGTYMWFQNLGGGGRRIRGSRSFSIHGQIEASLVYTVIESLLLQKQGK